MWTEAEIIKESELDKWELHSLNGWANTYGYTNIMIVKCSSFGQYIAGNTKAFASNGMNTTLGIKYNMDYL